jgi:hypothetical protein
MNTADDRLEQEPRGDDPRPLQLEERYELRVEVRGEGRKVYDSSESTNDERSE